MRKLIFLNMLVVLLLLGCSTTKSFDWFSTTTQYPQEVVDSISHSNNYRLTPYRNWDSYQFFTSDSTVQTVWFYFISEKQSNFIISVQESQDSTYIIKFRNR